MFHEEFSFDEFKPYLDLINANYFHWDEIPKDNRFKGLDLKLLWAIVKLSRNINFKTIKFKDYVLQYNQTPTIEKTLHDLDVRIGGKIDFGVANLSPNLQNKYLINSLREEAIASSQLEGAVTTRIVAKEFLRENKQFLPIFGILKDLCYK